MPKASGNGRKIESTSLPKCPTGIQGLDEVTGGGLPRGRPTLVCGSAGCGKTLFGMEFLVHGALTYNEPGVFVAFEESPEELTANVRSLGYDLDALAEEKKLLLDVVQIERSQIEEIGEYDLEGLFIRLGHAIDSIGAKRVVLDTLESLFSVFTNQAVLRAELCRLFRWLKDRGVTAIITGERGDGSLTRQGLEEYVSDCVILLDHRVVNQISTRRLRVVKYRGTSHGTNEYPFLIDESGISVLPITSVGLQHAVSEERISSGVRALDEMLGGEGYYRGTSILVSGTAGTGKTSIASHFADAACRRGERCLYFAFEESPQQLARNMRSIGLDLEPWMKKGVLRFHASRPMMHGLEMHLAKMHKEIKHFDPRVVVVDPISNLATAGSDADANCMMIRLIDFLKSQQVTALLTNLTSGTLMEQTEIGISSLIDTWLLVRDIELSGERNRGLYVLKSRGMAHSNQVREFRLTDRGIELVDVYVGPEGVLTGSSRLAQESRERAAQLVHQQDIERKKRDVERQRAALEAQMALLRADLESREEEYRVLAEQDDARERRVAQDRVEMGQSRHARTSEPPTPRKAGVKGNRS